MKKICLSLLAAIILITGCGKAEADKGEKTSAGSLVIGTTGAIETTEEIPSESETCVPETTEEEETTEVVEETTVAEEETSSPGQIKDEYYSGLVEQAKAEGRKVVYLTFDDGSSGLTPTVLDILDEYNVKATFFVVGAYSGSEENAKTEYNDIINRGHTLGIHSYTHSRAEMYASLEAFSKECDNMYDYVVRLTGYTPFLWRFPGGSATRYADSKLKTEYVPYIENKGLTYYDWNVSSGDGSSKTTTDMIYNNVINGVKTKSVSVVLMHDGSGHEKTVAALPRILDTLINELNCLIVPITESTIPVQYNLN